MVVEYMRQISNLCVEQRPEMRMEGIKAKDCVRKDTYVFTFIFNSFKLLIIFLINLTVRPGPP
jgi:hypothetical protein